MSIFPCQSCGEDLTYRIDASVIAVRSMLDNSDDLPEAFVVSGACPECEFGYYYEGKMFSHYMKTKIMDDTEVDEELVNTPAVVLTKDERKHLDSLIAQEKFKEVEEFLRSLEDKDL